MHKRLKLKHLIVVAGFAPLFAFAQAGDADKTAAIKELGYGGAQGEHMVVVENTAAIHNMVVCTLCSCYPWDVLSLPPVWYKSAPYRSRAVKDPRGVLADREFAELAERIQVATSATRPPTGPPPTIRTPGSATLGPSNLVTDRSSTHSAPTSNALD